MASESPCNKTNKYWKPNRRTKKRPTCTRMHLITWSLSDPPKCEFRSSVQSPWTSGTVELASVDRHIVWLLVEQDMCAQLLQIRLVLTWHIMHHKNQCKIFEYLTYGVCVHVYTYVYACLCLCVDVFIDYRLNLDFLKWQYSGWRISKHVILCTQLWRSVQTNLHQSDLQQLIQSPS